MKNQCEAKAIMVPDTLLSDKGYKISVSCQRCEVPISEMVIRKKDQISMADVNKFVGYFLQRCPKLISEGFEQGAIPSNLLPSIEERQR